MAERALALIPAAGQGARFGAEKQFLDLAGMPMIAHTCHAFQKSPRIEAIVLVVPPGWVDKTWKDIVKPYLFSKVKEVVAGGRERQESVRFGLEAIDAGDEIVVIHDGARPLVTQEIIARAVQETRARGATLVGVPATDTIVQVNSQREVTQTLKRDELWLVQTPQSFRYPLIVKAHQAALDNGYVGTDDASLVERIGHSVFVLQGSYENIKVTTPQDHKIAEHLLLGRSGNAS